MRGHIQNAPFLFIHEIRPLVILSDCIDGLNRLAPNHRDDAEEENDLRFDEGFDKEGCAKRGSHNQQKPAEQDRCEHNCGGFEDDRGREDSFSRKKS
jgi:hypothetical protein